MKKITLNLIAIVCMHFAFGQTIQSQSVNRSEIDEFILEQMDVFHVPGLSACIVIGDSVVWNNNYGYMNLEDSFPVNDSSLFLVASISKSITAACVMQNWDKGLLGLDQPINDFLPFQVLNPWNGAENISARMLMSHSAGIKDVDFFNYVTIGDATIPLSYFMENYLCIGGEYYSAGNFFNGLPGNYFHYSNFGIALNGCLIEGLTNLSFNDYAIDSLLVPLEMNSSGWHLNEINIDNLSIGYDYAGNNFIPQPHVGHPAYPGVSLRTTALELSHYVIMLLNRGVYNGSIILSEAAVDSMTTVQNPNWIIDYGTTGLGLFQRDDFGDRIVWGHNGGSTGGCAAQFYFSPEENTGIVITTNSNQYVDPIVEYLFDYAAIITNIPENFSEELNIVNTYPNPVNGHLFIDFELENVADVLLEVYSVSGKKIKALNEKTNSTGKQHFEMNMQGLPPGIYFLRLQAGNEVVTKKVVKL